MGEATKTVFNNNVNEKNPCASKLRPFLLSVLLVHHLFAIYEVVIASLLDTSQMTPEVRALVSVHTDYSFRFFTTWNFTGQLVYILMELALIFAPTTQFSKRISDLSWVHFMSVLWPSTFYIMSIFWSLFNIDRELIFPVVCDFILPWHVNHSMHTMIIALLLVEFFTSTRDYLPKYSTLSNINYIYMAAYCITFNYTFLWNGVWIYPFLYLLTWFQRMLLYIGTFLACQIFTKFGYYMMSMRCKHVAAKSLNKVN